MSARHSLRTDLEFSAQNQQGQSFVVVKDPVTLRYFRFSANQAVILEQLRSPATVPELAGRVESSLGARVNPESLERFIDSLDQKKLIETPATREYLDALRDRRPKDKQNVLYLQLVSFDAGKAFAWLLPRVRWCFTPLFHVFALTIILIGFALTTLHAEELFAQFLSLISLYGVLMVWCVVCLVTCMHEFAHGLTCTYFGGKVRRIGFMLIYFSPALYCDVSDAWMLPNRRQRVWVTFAGGYFQLVVWGIATILWRLVAPDTVISNLALAAIMFGGTQTLFNFNPLIKLDGYYMLSDYLEIPNLREKAFRALNAWLAGRSDPLLESKDRRTLLAYAGLAATFSTLLLTVVYVNIYGFATSRLQFAGLIVFLMFSGLTLRRAASEPAAGLKALATRAALKKYRTIGILVVLVGVSLIPWQLRIAADFEVLPREEATVRSETAGTISVIHVREGTLVEKGDLIAELSDVNKLRELSQIEGSLEQKQAELRALEAGPRVEELERIRRLVETREAELANVLRVEELTRLTEELGARQAELRLAQRELDQAQLLFESELGPRFDVERWEETVEVRQRVVNATQSEIDILAESNAREQELSERRLAEAQSELAVLEAGSRAEDIQQRSAEVATLERSRDLLNAELEKTLIRAPITGTIATPFIERLVNRRLNSGDEIARLVNLETVTASLQVPEKEMADVALGSRVQLKARSYPSRDFEGAVDMVAPVADTLAAGRFVEIRTTLDNSDGALLPEMTGVAKIYAGRRLVFQLMTRRIVRWIRTEFWDLLP